MKREQSSPKIGQEKRSKRERDTLTATWEVCVTEYPRWSVYQFDFEGTGTFYVAIRNPVRS